MGEEGGLLSMDVQNRIGFKDFSSPGPDHRLEDSILDLQHLKS